MTVKGHTVSWRGAAPPAATSFAVYKVNGDKAPLVATTRQTTWTDPAAPGTYCVTALDRSWNESQPSIQGMN